MTSYVQLIVDFPWKSKVRFKTNSTLFVKVLKTTNTILVTWILHDVNNQVRQFLGIWAFR